mmetsp:Transcript_2162/g.7272  ORF Transcript_2162/g.7272 Transcript_2162/m.7272 type:complete len:217 (-) Transcript_2162:209-859(-)
MLRSSSRRRERPERGGHLPRVEFPDSNNRGPRGRVEEARLCDARPRERPGGAAGQNLREFTNTPRSLLSDSDSSKRSPLVDTHAKSASSIALNSRIRLPQISARASLRFDRKRCPLKFSARCVVVAKLQASSRSPSLSKRVKTEFVVAFLAVLCVSRKSAENAVLLGSRRDLQSLLVSIAVARRRHFHAMTALVSEVASPASAGRARSSRVPYIVM